MSKEFEAEVLKMFGKIDSRLDNIENTLDEHTKDIKGLKETVSENSKDIKELKETVSENSKDIKRLNDTVAELKETTEENTRNIKKMNESLDVYNNFFIKYENEFSKKIQVLFDFVSMNEDKHAMYDDLMLHYNSKFLNHSIRISALEDLIKEKSDFKTKAVTA